MTRWAFLADPEAYGWDDLVREGHAVWDGVKNAIAQRNLNTCRPGDEALVYNTAPDKSLRGIARVVSQPYADPTAPDRVVVDVEPVTALNRPLPSNYPVVGEDAFRTGTGVHAAAIVKARRMGDEWLADMVYSGVPAHLVGRCQVIEISHVSGMSNVRHWLAEHGYDESDDGLCRHVFALAKRADRVLTDAEVRGCCAEYLELERKRA